MYHKLNGHDGKNKRNTFPLTCATSLSIILVLSISDKNYKSLALRIWAVLQKGKGLQKRLSETKKIKVLKERCLTTFDGSLVTLIFLLNTFVELSLAYSHKLLSNRCNRSVQNYVSLRLLDPYMVMLKHLSQRINRTWLYEDLNVSDTVESAESISIWGKLECIDLSQIRDTLPLMYIMRFFKQW